MGFIRHYLIAVQFFTRLPVTGKLAGWVGYSPQMLRASAAHFPGVGWLVAMLACAVYAFTAFALPAGGFTPLAAAVISTIATVLVTGAFHEDGLADTADGLGGSAGRERALEIMKDSRIGAYGALALVLAVLAKVSLLAVLGSQSMAAAVTALLAGHVLSRFWPLLLILALPHVGDTATSKSKPLAERIETGALGIALGWCVIPLAIAVLAMGWLFVLCGALLSAAALLWMARVLQRRLQGFTGDCLGAAQQLCEIAFYFGAALALG